MVTITCYYNIIVAYPLHTYISTIMFVVKNKEEGAGGPGVYIASPNNNNLKLNGSGLDMFRVPSLLKS